MTGQERSVPPFRWLLAGGERRRRAWRYWCVDTVLGIYDTTLHCFMRLLPIDVCSSLGAFLSFYGPFFFPEATERARQVWMRLRPEQADPASTDAAVRRLHRAIGRTMAEFSVVHRLWDAGRISVEGIAHFQAARAASKPILVAALHLGNWEALLVAGIRSGFPGSGIYLPLESRFQLRLAQRARTRYGGGQVAGVGPGALRAALRALRANEGPFVMFVDEFARGRVQAPAFGRDLRADSNLAYAVRLAVATDAALIPAYCERQGDGARFVVTFLPPVEMLRNGQRDGALQENMARLNAVIEPAILAHLDQWYFAFDLKFDEAALAMSGATPEG